MPNWFSFCSGEDSQCRFTGPAQVIFGTLSGSAPSPNGPFREQTLYNSTVCSGAVFGDPAPGQPKACWIGPVPGLGSGSISQIGGSNYPFQVQNFGSWDDNQRVLVGLYHLDPTLVEAQLRQIYKSGQRNVALVLWYMPFESSLSPGGGIPVNWPDVWGAYLNSSGGQLSVQAQQNLQAILGLIQTIGFNQVTVRFGPIGSVANATTWGNTWNEAAFEQDEQFEFNTRQLVENTLAGSSVQRLYDLGVEQAGVPHNLNTDNVTYTDGQTPEWTSRLWSDYVRTYGGGDSYGFSIAYSYGKLALAIAEYDAAGNRPSSYGLDVYATGNVWNIYQELLAAGEPAKPVVIQETHYDDAGMSQDFVLTLQHIPLTIAYIDQWVTNANTPNADGMTPPTNFGMYGGTTTPSGTIIGYPCAVAPGQSTCTTSVSWSTSNSANAALYVNGVQAANLPNILSTLTGTTTVTLSSSPTTLTLTQNANGFAGPDSAQSIIAQLSLTAVSGTAPTLALGGLSGSSNPAVWALGSGISPGCMVNLFDPNGSATLPVVSLTGVSCQSTSLSFQLPATIYNNYSVINMRVVNPGGLASGPLGITIQQVPSLSTGGAGDNQIWAVGAAIATGCAVNLYDPNGSATLPVASVTSVNCQPNSLSFSPPAAINNFSAINVSVINPGGLASKPLKVPIQQVPSLAAAGTGGSQIWAIGSGFATGCAVNLSDPNGSATVPVASVTNVGCQPTSLSFEIPASVNNYSAINANVVNPGGLTSQSLTIAIQQVPSLAAAGTGGSQIWALGSGFASGCAVNLYDPNGSSTVPLASVTNVSCQSTSLSFEVPASVNNFSAINVSVVNPGGLASKPLTVAIQQMPSLAAAGTGGSQIWALGAGIASGCMVNLYDPNGSSTVPLASVTNVSCQSTSLSFEIPASVNNFSAINVSVVNPGGLASKPLTVSIRQGPSLAVAGTGGDQIWALGSGFASGCTVNLYDPNGSSTVPLASVTNVSCQSSSLSFEIPGAVNNFSAINVSVVNPDGSSSGQLRVSIH